VLFAFSRLLVRASLYRLLLQPADKARSNNTRCMPSSCVSSRNLVESSASLPMSPILTTGNYIPHIQLYNNPILYSCHSTIFVIGKLKLISCFDSAYLFGIRHALPESPFSRNVMRPLGKGKTKRQNCLRSVLNMIIHGVTLHARDYYGVNPLGTLWLAI
jgi:hypothetical protein